MKICKKKNKKKKPFIWVFKTHLLNYDENEKYIIVD